MSRLDDLKEELHDLVRRFHDAARAEDDPELSAVTRARATRIADALEKQIAVIEAEIEETPEDRFMRHAAFGGED